MPDVKARAVAPLCERFANASRTLTDHAQHGRQQHRFGAIDAQALFIAQARPGFKAQQQFQRRKARLVFGDLCGQRTLQRFTQARDQM